MELRCPNGILHGILTEGVIEVKCRSSRCGHQEGVVVLHMFNAQTGELMETSLYRDPIRKEQQCQ